MSASEQPRAPRWHVRIRGQELGAFSAAELRAHAADGKLKPDDEVRREGDERWRSAGSIQGLFAEAAKSERAYDVFVSHSKVDKTTADAMVHVLEQRGVRCWIAPRDIVPGATWAGSIMHGIGQCRLLVMVFSKSSNQSHHVHKEIERAIDHGLTIVPFRIDDTKMAPELEYLISSYHWLDAFSEPLEKHLEQLADSLEKILAPAPAAAERKPRVAVQPRKPARASSKRIAMIGAVALLAVAAASWGYVAKWSRTAEASPETSDPVAGDESHLERSAAPQQGEPLAAQPEASRADVRRAALLTACAPGKRWSLASAPAHSLTFTDGERDGSRVIAVLTSNSADAAPFVFEGGLDQPGALELGNLGRVGISAGDAVLQLTLANLPRPRDAKPCPWSTLALASVDGKLRAMSGASEVRVEGQPSSVSVPTSGELRERLRSALAADVELRGTVGNGGAGATLFTLRVTDFDEPTGALRVLVALDTDPSFAAAYQGTCATDPLLLRTWPVRLEKLHDNPREHATLSLLDASDAELWLRPGSDHELTGVLRDERVTLRRNPEPVQPLAGRIDELLEPGTRLRGRSRSPSGEERDITVTWIAIDQSAAPLHATLELNGRPDVFFALDGARFPHPWPLRLARYSEVGWERDQGGALLGRGRAELWLRPGPGASWVGWCGDETLDLEPTDGADGEPGDWYGDGLRERLWDACAVGKEWRGTARNHARGSSYDVALRFTAADRATKGVQAEVTWTFEPRGVAHFAGKLADAPPRAAAWALVLQRTEAFDAPVAGELLGMSRSSLALRLDPSGTLHGWSGDDVLELTVVDRPANAVEPAQATPTADRQHDSLMQALTRADAARDRGALNEARDELNRARRALTKENAKLRLLVDLRLAWLLYLEGESVPRIDHLTDRDEGKANNLYQQALNKLRDIRDLKGACVYDQHDVCGQAHAAYYEARVWIVMGYTAGDNYFNEAIKAVSRLTESFPSACGADGKNFAAQAAAELDKLKERHRQDVARQRRGQR